MTQTFQSISANVRQLSLSFRTRSDGRRKLVTELKTRSAESETLREGLASIVSTLEFSEIIQRVLDQIKQVVPYDSASVWRMDGERQKLIGGQGLPTEIMKPDFEMVASDEENSGLLVVKGEVPYMLYNNVQEERADFRESPHNYINSWLAVPLKTKGKIIGLICLDGRSKNQFNTHHAELAVTFANQVAVALENAQLFSKLQDELAEHKQAEAVIRQREAILGAIAFAAEQFLKTADWRVNIDIVLENLGRVIDCTHVYIFENFLTPGGQLATRMTYEWAADGYRSEIMDEKYQNILLEEDGFKYWYEMLKSGETFVSSSPTLPKDEIEHLHERGIKALVDVPIFVKGKWWGIIGFDDMVKERAWSAAELDALKVASNVFGAAIQRQQVESEIHQINMDLEQRVEQRTVQLQDANQNLNREKALLEQYSRQREIMAAMTDLLQASLTMQEASGIISTYLKLLFPNRVGALYLSTVTNTFEPVAVWGGKKSLDIIYTINECWALRRGKPYQFGIGSPNPPCAHVGKEIPQHALCIPFSAQGESLGNLHISMQNNQEGEFINDEERRFLETTADSIALAIANLRLREKLHFESIRDGLTGLFNRRYLDETLPREIHRAERNKHSISVLMFDIDHFKKFNDTFGHDAGDIVLKSMAGLMLSGVREGDIACRYGGEEFTIILPDTPIEVAARRAENLRYETSIMKLSHNGQNLGNVTISIGVAAYPQNGTTRDILIKCADEASYKAKETGRNRVVVCG